MRREERVTVQGPVRKQQPDGMSHRRLKSLCLEGFEPGSGKKELMGRSARAGNCRPGFKLLVGQLLGPCSTT